MKEDLDRFVTAQESSYATALEEIKRGKKTTHWMWYIFPQLAGLGYSTTSYFYGIKGIEEATAYLQHKILGVRLIEISTTLLSLSTADAYKVFGSSDDQKLRSSMTLFSSVKNADPVFGEVLKKFFAGTRDEKTLRLLGKI